MKHFVSEAEKHAMQLHKRAAVSGSVILHDRTHWMIAPLINLSTGGIFVEGKTPLEKGCRVKLIVRSPGLDEPVQARGNVVRVEKGKRTGLAIEFTSLSSEDRRKISTYVRETRTENLLK